MVLLALREELLVRAFDPQAARAMGYRVGLLDLTLNRVIAVVVAAGGAIVLTAAGIFALSLVVAPVVGPLVRWCAGSPDRSRRVSPPPDNSS